MRYSLQKETIREIVTSTDSHPTADWIFHRAKRKIPNISLGTVYRNLKHLAAEGFLRVICDDNSTRYDWNTTPHDHLKCSICGDLIDVHLLDDGIRKTVKKNYKFEVDDVEMIIIGTCNKHEKKGV
ncbi:MAG: transcriptional repressor [Candidatus Marinimicrobia bacterium]|jgi:Fe2+ or Zn2+ uptake regulation protein|nr:transcriptional repressor [Candidatus Neomarinimicrobiota bacterium]MDP7060026.1 transcriptional repressor [Candidatus Neomarinimicrobiota bacterium]